MGQSYRLRRPTLLDLASLLNIENSCFSSDKLSDKSLRSFINNKKNCFILAESKVGVVAYSLCLLRANSKIARLYSFAVLPKFQGQGVAKLLLEETYSKLKKQKIKKLRLEVREDNFKAVNFYQKQGFKTFAQIPQYYQDGASAYRMEKQISK